MAKHTKLLATIALLSAGVAGQAAAQTIKIGVNEPLTGPFAASGTYVVNGAKIAADEINSRVAFSARRSSLSSKTTRATRPKLPQWLKS